MLQDRRQCGACVFGINVDASGENALVCDVSSAEIKPPLDREMSLVFDLLRDEFAEDDLLGEVLASDDNAGLAGAGGEEQSENDNNQHKSPTLPQAQGRLVSLPRTERQG